MYRHRNRNYLHFDPQPSAMDAEALATDPEKVACHAFYPFMGYTICTPRVKKDENGNFSIKLKKRPIKLAAHMDAAIYSHYSQMLSGNFEADLKAAGLDHCVTAFRRVARGGKSNIHFADEVFQFIQNNRPCSVIGVDIENFFVRMDHGLLKRRWTETLREDRLPKDHFNIFKSLTQFSWVDRDRAFSAVGINPKNPRAPKSRRASICSTKEFRTKVRGKGLVWKNPEWVNCRGIPQGSPISAILSNIYMFGLDKKIHDRVASVNGLYRRYCDDMIVVVPNDCSHEIEQFIIEAIQDVRLTINPNKTSRASFPADPDLPAERGNSVQYLGFDFNGIQKLIRSSSLSRYYSKMRKGVRLAKLTHRKKNRLERKNGEQPSALRKRQLYIRYTYLIRRRYHSKKGSEKFQNENFITYAHRASKVMNAPEINRQVRGHMRKLKAELRKSI